MQGPPGYQDPDVPDVGMPGDDDDTPNLGGSGSGGLPPAPGAPGHSGSGILIPVPDDAEPSVAVIPDGGDDDDNHPPYPMEVHVEPPPPGGPPDAPGAKQTFANPDQYMQPQSHVPASQPIVPIPKHPEFRIPRVMRHRGMRR